MRQLRKQHYKDAKRKMCSIKKLQKTMFHWKLSIRMLYLKIFKIKPSKSLLLQRNSNPQPLSSQKTLNHLTKLVKWLTCFVCTHLYINWRLCAYIKLDTRLEWIYICSWLNVKEFLGLSLTWNHFRWIFWFKSIKLNFGLLLSSGVTQYKKKCW